jgi:hypothetical protein
MTRSITPKSSIACCRTNSFTPWSPGWEGARRARWVNEGLATVLEPAGSSEVEAILGTTDARPALSKLHTSFVGLSTRDAEIACASSALAVRVRSIDERHLGLPEERVARRRRLFRRRVGRGGGDCRFRLRLRRVSGAAASRPMRTLICTGRVQVAVPSAAIAGAAVGEATARRGERRAGF